MDLKKTAINKNIKADKDNSTVPLYGDIKPLRAGGQNPRAFATR
jgi:hypothetical protein